MSSNVGPNTINSGRVVSIDAANQKSLNIPSQSNHGYAEWYCFVSGTATYSIIDKNGGTIYENNAGSITALVTSTGPQRGTISVTAGRKYYGSVPVNLVVEDAQHCIAPLTMLGTQFWHYSNRGNPTTYYVYSPYENATVNFYDNTVGGLTATPTSTHSITAGQATTITSNNLTNQWLSSSTPVLATATQTGSDKTILSPMAKYVYQRYQNYWNTTNNTTATNINAYAVYDSSYNVMTMNIADGSGGDSAQGLGLEYLSNTYSWGNVLSDYTIVFPYNATVTAEYWNGTSWVVWDTHMVTTGSITNPPRVARDGTTGPGVEATALHGAVNNMASGATLWRWVGNSPFYLCINDNADDEFSVLGWMSSTTSTPRSSNLIKNTSINNNGTLMASPVFDSSNMGIIVFNGTTNYIDVGSIISDSQLNGGSWTASFWVNFASVSKGTDNSLLSHGAAGTNTGLHLVERSSRAYFGFYANDLLGTIALSANTWYNIVYTFNNTTKIKSIYVNGKFDTSGGTVGYSGTGSNAKIGRWLSATNYLNGKLGAVYFYSTLLSANEITNHFNALRSRYGI